MAYIACSMNYLFYVAVNGRTHPPTPFFHGPCSRLSRQHPLTICLLQVVSHACFFFASSSTSRGTPSATGAVDQEGAALEW